jgi:hypothetical protein
MPDPVLFAKAVIASALASTVFVLAAGWERKPPSAMRVNIACILGIGVGVALGCYVLALLPHWPPAAGLERFLTIVLTAAIGIELIAGSPRVRPAVAWLLRLCLAAAAGRILLHGSSYLAGGDADWTTRQILIALALSAGLLAVVWGLLAWLARRSPGFSIPLAVSEACLGGGLAIMLSGSVTLGEAALPLGAAIAAVTAASCLITGRPVVQGVVAVGLVGLFSLLVLGRFFAMLSTARAGHFSGSAFVLGD